MVIYVSLSPWYTHISGVKIEDQDADCFMDHQPDPRHDTVLAKVYDDSTKDLLSRHALLHSSGPCTQDIVHSILEPDPAKRPGEREQQPPVFHQVPRLGTCLSTRL